MSKRLSIVVIEDDPAVMAAFHIFLKDHQLHCFETLNKFVESKPLPEVDLVCVDLCHEGDPCGMESVNKIPLLKRLLPHAEIVIQSGVRDVALMRACVQNGADKFILKQHIKEELLPVIEKAEMLQKVRAAMDALLFGEHSSMRALKAELLTLRLNPSVNVLIEGETGSGKELCAQSLHDSGPFIAVNMSAVPAELFEAEFFGAERGSYTNAHQTRAGYFESAAAGTLFLDEVQSLPLALQSKLLRVLETRRFSRIGSGVERPVMCRVVSATNQNLKELVGKGEFREDLYFRLTGSILQLPPLRLRGTDSVTLAERFLKESDSSGHIQFTDAARVYIQSGYDWPGNVRELKAVIASCVAKSRIPFIDVPELEAEILSKSPSLSQTPLNADCFIAKMDLGFDENVKQLERHLIELALKDANPSHAYQKLNMSRSRFYEKMKTYGLIGP